MFQSSIKLGKIGKIIHLIIYKKLKLKKIHVNLNGDSFIKLKLNNV